MLHHFFFPVRETEKVVSHIVKSASTYESIGKTQFEATLHEIMQQVEKNTTASSDEIAATTSNVIEDMPNE